MSAYGGYAHRQQENTAQNPGGYRSLKPCVVLPEIQTGRSNQLAATEHVCNTVPAARYNEVFGSFYTQKAPLSFSNSGYPGVLNLLFLTISVL